MQRTIIFKDDLEEALRRIAISRNLEMANGNVVNISLAVREAIRIAASTLEQQEAGETTKGGL